MNFLRATLAVLFALAFAVPSQAAPELSTSTSSTSTSSVRTRIQPQAMFTTGLHANQVEPIVRGLLVETASVAAYTTCFLALASESTCVDIASKARASLSR